MTTTTASGSTRAVLITGANGEVGHGLIKELSKQGGYEVVALDVRALDSDLQGSVSAHYQGDILDSNLIGQISKKHTFEKIFHFASILSTGGEKDPQRAHEINVNGTLNILNLAREHSQRLQSGQVANGGSPELRTMVLFPSTIAAHGIPTLQAKNIAGALAEDDFLEPITMYGINKLYMENLGRYYSRHYRILADPPEAMIDFRCVRFPGLLSADTVPTGGTSDYGPEMLHYAARGLPYACFVRPDSTIPFMAMPDGIKALLKLAAAPRERLSRLVYNVSSFSVSAETLRNEVLRYFPNAKISFKVDERRQRIVDSWPADVNDNLARADWGWDPTFDLGSSFRDYLLPGIFRRYGQGGAHPNCANM